jgi:hypothetical protein
MVGVRFGSSVAAKRTLHSYWLGVTVADLPVHVNKWVRVRVKVRVNP